MATEKNKNNAPEHKSPIQYDPALKKQKEDVRKISEKLRKEGKLPEPIIVTKNNEVKKATELTLKEREDEIIRCAANPQYFIETYLTIFDQTKGEDGEIVPFKLFDFQVELINEYYNNKFIVANKYRQAGISTTTCAYIAWYIMFNSNRSVAIVANKLETARDELMKDVVDFIDNCPTWLRPNPTVKDTQKLKRYDNNCELGAFSSSGLRGYTPTLLFWDETAWTEKSDVFWTSAAPTLQTGGRAIFVSTPNGLDPVFYKTFQAARKGESTFKAVELWWFNDPRYNEGLEWVKNKGKDDEIRIKDDNWSKEYRIKLQDDGWEATSPWFENQVLQSNGDMRKIAQELLCSFLGSGDNFIAEKYLKRIQEEEILVPIRQEYTDNNFWIWEDYIEGEDYLMSIDASPGHGEDFSTINILKTNEYTEEKVVTKNGKSKKAKIRKTKSEQVAEYYGKVTPQMLAEIAYQFGRRYGNALAVVDVTGGYGIQTVEKLFEFGYPEESIYFTEVKHKPTRDMLFGYIKQGQKTMPDGNLIQVDLVPGFFIGDNRASVLLEMQRSIHVGDVTIRSSRLLNELKTFVTVGGNRVADHKRSFHDDSIMGLACGLYVLSFDMSRFKRNKGNTKKMLDALINVNDPEKIQKMKSNTQSKINQRKHSTPIRSSDPDLQKHLENEWLFKGLKNK